MKKSSLCRELFLFGSSFVDKVVGKLVAADVHADDLFKLFFVYLAVVFTVFFIGFVNAAACAEVKMAFYQVKAAFVFCKKSQKLLPKLLVFDRFFL